MSALDYIDISSDEETEIKDVKDVKPIVLSTQACYRIANNQALCKDYPIIQGVKEENDLTIVNENLYGSCMTERVRSSTDEFCSPSALLGSSLPLCRQFWKSGDYEAGKALQPPSQNGKNRLRIHPRFLHSNATSHKWAFGAVAELLDNALDEVQNGATFVIIDKFTNPRNRDSALLVQDDGGGMDPNSLRRCMSFGFSDKQSDVSIGQYGNGFKTSTMRLGADAIVFSRCMNNRVLTQSVGLLSYTFLRQTGSDDIVVPVVDYELNSSTGAFGRLVRTDQKQFASNLSTLLKWSPFASESELLKQFNDIGHHGTKVIVFNLWYNDDGVTELDFESDATDIRINGERKKVSHGCDMELTERYVATQLQYSLRAYASILYLHIPGAFKILLRGQVVMPHNVVHDLIYRECIQYKPQVDGNLEAVVLTTLGFLNGAPRIDVQGFNVYHKNRLILPFWRVTTNSYGKGRGVVGVLEANFIKPTHDKQDFEKSTIYQKLENRLKEMTYEYWDFHCHLIGYKSKLPPSKLASAPAPVHQLPPLRTYNAARHAYRSHGAASIAGAPQSQVISTPSGQTYNSKAQTGIPQKRKLESLVSATEPLGKQAIKVSNHKIQPEHNGVQKQSQEIETMMQENKKLQEQCLAYEEAGKLLMLKEARLRRELQEVQQTNKNLLAELRSLDEIKVEKS